MSSEDRELIDRFRRGEPGSFEALYAGYGTRVYRFCYRLCGQAADAEDLTQEVFLAAFQGLDRFAGRSSLATWLYRVALFRWRRLHGGQQPESVSLDEAPEVAATAPDPAFVASEHLALEDALASLPEAPREAFLLVKVEGLKYREAAGVLDVPQGTVQSRVHDAVMRLRALLAEDETAPAVVVAARAPKVRPCGCGNE